jgi:long-subunit acyl-CoA synthetase (AMP-forming)
LSTSIEKESLAKSTEGDGKEWKFVGIWSKNRKEWLETYIANMYCGSTTIGFFDSMGAQAVDFIIEQT